MRLLHFTASVLLLALNTSVLASEVWQVLGDMRAGWVQYDYNNPPPGDPNIHQGNVDSKGFYVVPKLSVITPTLEGFYAKVTGAVATDFGLNDPEYESRTFVLGRNGKSYAILQEAHVAYDKNGHRVLIGAEESDTPMINTDEGYMLANTFQVATYTNTAFEHMIFSAGYFHKMAGVFDNGIDGTHYQSMAKASFVSFKDRLNAKDRGIVYGAFQYDDTTHNFQFWNYYATDLYNTLFVQYDLTQNAGSFSYDIGLQFINFKAVGALSDNDHSRIDYSLYSARFDGTFENGFTFDTGAAKYTDGEGQSSTLGAWGGYPYFVNGMIFHFFEAGSLQNAASYKAQAGYNVNDAYWLGVRYTHWDLDPLYSKTLTGESQDFMKTYGFHLSYNSKSGGYFTGTYEYLDLDNEPKTFGLRLIGGYRF